MELETETSLVEAILFLESEVVSEKHIANVASLSVDVVKKCLVHLKEVLSAKASGIELEQIAGGWTLVPKKNVWNVLREKYGTKSEGKLSRSALETLSIIAYSQPITRSEVEAIRGVSSDAMIRMLIERKLVKEVGKKDAPGKPTLFGTTKEFLKFFKLNSISDLPKLDAEEAERFELAR